MYDAEGPGTGPSGTTTAQGAMADDWDALQDAIDGRPPDRETAELAALARAVGRLQVPGPDQPARERIWARMEARMEGRRGGPVAWLLGWAGLGSERRPLVQRLAGGAVLLAAAVGGATAAGVDTTGALRGIAEFGASAVRNLAPVRGGEGGTSDGGATAGPGESATTPGTQTPSHGSGTATPARTPPTPGAGGANGGPTGVAGAAQTPTPTMVTPTPTVPTPTPTVPTPTPTVPTPTPTPSPTPGDDDHDDDDEPGSSERDDDDGEALD